MNLDLIEMIQILLMDGSFFWHFDFLLKSTQPFTGLFYMCLSFCPQGDVVSQHALQVVSQHACRSRGGGFPAYLAVLQAHTQGKLRGLAWGVSRPTPKGWVEGSGLGGSPGLHPGGSWGVRPGEVSRPIPRGGSWGVWSGVSRPTPGRVSRPTPGGCLQAHTWGGLQADTQGSIPGCTEADSPHEQMATAAGGTHPSGMHSCLLEIVETVVSSCRCEKLSRSIATNESPGREQGTTLWGLFIDLGYNFGGKWHMHL